MSTRPAKALNDAELQLAASTLVGQLVFEFSRIDMELGLFIALGGAAARLGCARRAH